MSDKNEVIIALLNEKDKLEKIIRKTEARLARAPEGSLRIQKHGNGYQFFLRTGPKDKNGVYIPAAERKTAFELIQKRYDQQVLAAARKQAAAIEAFLKKYEPDCLKKIYDSLIEARKMSIDPVEIPDGLYAELWQAVEYEPGIIPESAPLHYTGRGEKVRSKSEVIIADALARAGVPYRYEYPMKINGQIIHPDFTVLRKRDRREFIWEHLGMTDDPEYRNNALHRIRQYEREGLFPGGSLILTTETQKQPLNTAAVDRIIRHYLL